MLSLIIQKGPFQNPLRWYSGNDFLKVIGQRFKESDKAKINIFLKNFSNARQKYSGSVRNYILKIVPIGSRLGEVNIHMIDDFVIHCAFDSLRLEYE